MDKINFEVALDRSFLTANKEQTAFVMLKLTAPELTLEKRPAAKPVFRDRPQR